MSGRAGLAVIGLVVVTILGCVPRLGDTEADLALEDIVAGPGLSRLKMQTPAPSRATIAYQVAGRRYLGDLYRSSEGARAGIVLVPGVVPEGKDDPRLVMLAHTLARLRFAVLVPELPGLRRYQVRRSDVGAVADAFRYLQSRQDVVPPGRVGIAGFSYGAGPVLLAGLESDIREQLRFILALGGYYDLTDLVTFFTTGYFRDEQGRWQYLQPQPYAAWVFALSNVDLLERPADRERLRDHVLRLAEEGGQAEPLPGGLGPDARALVALLQNRDPDRVPALIDRLPPAIRDEMTGIDPAAHDLFRLRALAILVHGRSDNIIPYTQSIALAHALQQDRAPDSTRLFLIDGFAHVDVALEQQDIPQLRRAMQLLLDQRAAPVQAAGSR